MGGPSTPPTPPPPKEYNDTVASKGTFFFIDALCEGPIKGLVEDKRSIYFDRTQLEYADGSTDYETTTQNFILEENFRFGTHNQPKVIGEFSNTCSFIDLYSDNRITSKKPQSYAISTSTYQLISKITINIATNGLYTYIDKTGVDYGFTGWTGDKIKSIVRSKNSGDTVGAPIELNIFVRRNNGNEELVKNLRIFEKASQGVIFSVDVEFPRNNVEFPSLSWTDSDNSTFFVRIQRVSEDGKTSKVRNATSIDSIIVFQDISVSYPNTAYAAIQLDTESFQTLPERLYLLDMKLVKVPVNHTSPRFDKDGLMTREPHYSGVWNGKFKLDWTNNPAWIMYDILTDKRYGLGNQIPYSNIDKWTIYEIARYCDAISPSGTFSGVSNTLGQKEQRFTANLFLSEQNDAVSVLKDMSSIFRGNILWNNNAVTFVQDLPRATAQVFTNSNVINGVFSYSSAAQNVKPSAVKVRWNDPSDFYQAKTEHIENLELISRQGLVELDVAAFGCASQSQARRFGRWTLATENLETKMVTFKVPVFGIYTVPGDVIEVRDDILDRAANGGRVVSGNVSESSITLNKIVDYSVGGSISVTNYVDTLTPILDRPDSVATSADVGYIRPSFVKKFNIISQEDNVFENQSKLFVSASVTGIIPAAPFSINTLNSAAQLYRVIDISDFDEHGNVTLSCMEYSPEKFDESEISEGEFDNNINNSGINYSSYPIYPPTVLEIFNNAMPPSSNEGSFNNGSGAFLVGYAISGRVLPSGNYYKINRGAGNTFTDYISGSGIFEYVVKSVRSDGFFSAGITGYVTGFYSEVPGDGTTDRPFGKLVNGLNGSSSIYATESPMFTISSPNSTDSPEYGSTIDLQIRVRNETSGGFVSGVGSGIIALDWSSIGGPLYGATSTITTGGFVGDLLVTGWKFRKIGLDVRAISSFGATGEFTAAGFDNPAPPPCLITFSNVTNDSFDYYIAPSGTFVDLSAVDFYLSTGTVMPTGAFTKKYSFVDVISHNMNVTGLNVWFKPIDSFGDVGLIVNGPFPVSSARAGTSFSGVLTGTLISSENSRRSGSYIRFSWPSYGNAALTNYALNVQNNSGKNWTFYTPKEDVAGTVSFDLIGIDADTTYSGRLKTVRGTFEDSYGAWSAPVYVPPIKNKYISSSRAKFSSVNYDCGFDEVVLSNTTGVAGTTYVSTSDALYNGGVSLGSGVYQNRYLKISAEAGFSTVATGAVSGQYPVVNNAPRVADILSLQGALDLDYNFSSGQSAVSRLTIESYVNLPTIYLTTSINSGVKAQDCSIFVVTGASSVYKVANAYQATGDVRDWLALSIQSGFTYHYEIVANSKYQTSGARYIIKDFGKSQIQ